MPDTVAIETGQATAGAEGAVHIGGLDHVVLRVGSLERAIEFYRNVLGCQIERELQQPRLVQLRAGASLIDLVPAGSLADGGRRRGRAQHGSFRSANCRL